MEIKLLNISDKESLIQACMMPYQSEHSNKLLERVWDSGHRSIARHGMASFLIKDVSVSLLTQISRHPHINLTVLSSRYCDMSDRNFVIPPFVKEKDIQEYKDDMGTIKQLYIKWHSKEEYTRKELQEISKMFLPKASTVDLVMSGNFQALYEFLQLRNCIRAEAEIRQLAHEITNILKTLIPEIFGNLGCGGDEFGICPEGHGSCGKYPDKKHVKIERIAKNE